jgi:hypothetical protein
MTTNLTTINLKKSPNVLFQYARALFAKDSTQNSTLPSICLTLKNIKISLKNVKSYNTVCRINTKPSELAVAYPHMIAFPLHMELMLLKGFPFALMGLVHVRNEIIQHRVINSTEILNTHCYFGELRNNEKGTEFDIKVDTYIDDQLVWEEISTYFHRSKTLQPKKQEIKEASKVELIANPYDYLITLSENLGRAYASTSGDRNPIHLYSFTAKALGFKKHIIHGMWTKAYVVGVLSQQIHASACRVIVEFKQPIFLPSQVKLTYSKNKDLCEFDVRDKKETKLHVVGSISKLS